MTQTLRVEPAAVQWRNNRLAVASIYLSAAVIVLLGLMICLGGIGELMPFSMGHLGSALELSVLGIGSMWGGFGIWRMGRRAALNKAQFRSEAVHFFYGAKETDRINWSEIAKVTHGGGTVTIHAGPDRLLSFDAYKFFLPSRLGKAIAARAGKEFQS